MNLTPYSDKELQEFKVLITQKIEKAETELKEFNDILSNNNNGTDDTYKASNVNDDGQETLTREQSNILAQKQIKFIQALKNALIRIENKTYGVCVVTGEQIPKERLLIVPHTTQIVREKKKFD